MKNPDTAAVQKEILEELDQFLNRIEKQVYCQLIQYHEEKGEWPTYLELAEYMDLDKNTVQPRISELKERMLVTQNSKRPCKESSHNISVTTWKTVINHEEQTEKKEEEWLLKDRETGEVLAK